MALSVTNVRKAVIGFTIGAIVIFLWAMSAQLIVNVSATEYIVKQAFASGELTVFNTPGWKWQFFGDLTHYDRSRQLWFTKNSDQGKKIDQSLPIRFADGGDATISGSLRYDLPNDTGLKSLHQRYKNADAIQQELIIPTIQKAIQLTGPIMSSKESAAAKRNDLLRVIEDQIRDGVYLTRTEKVEIDDITAGEGKKKLVDILIPIADPTAPNGIARIEESPIRQAGIRISAVSINGIHYSDKVEKAIGIQQELEMEVATSVTRTRTAIQEAITAEATGKANTAKAEWAERELAVKQKVQAERNETVAVIEARKNLTVAETDRKTAEQTKAARILIAEGESKALELVAEARKKEMQADGALKQKLAAYTEVQNAYANALSKIRLPQIVMGSSSGNSAGAAGQVSSLMDLIMTKTAKDLSIDMTVTK